VLVLARTIIPSFYAGIFSCSGNDFALILEKSLLLGLVLKLFRLLRQ